MESFGEERVASDICRWGELIGRTKRSELSVGGSSTHVRTALAGKQSCDDVCRGAW